MLLSFSTVISVIGLATCMSILSSCGADDPAAEASHTAGTIAGSRMSEGSVRTAIKNAGFPSSFVNKMVCTAWYESNWHTASYNRNNNGSIDIGLLQINSINWSWCGATRTSLTDPANNARCGKKIFDSQGMGAWYGYRAHKAKCNAYGGGALPLVGDDTLGTDISIVDPGSDASVEALPNGYVDHSDMGNGVEVPESAL